MQNGMLRIMKIVPDSHNVMKLSYTDLMQHEEWMELTTRNMVEDYKKYKFFMDTFAPKICGTNIYEGCCQKKLPEDYISASAEAFALMSIENYMDAAHRAASTQRTERKPVLKGKYTCNSNAKKFCGYTAEGLELYNKLVGEVRAARGEARRKEHAQRYMDDKRDKFEGRQRKSKKRVRTEDEMPQVVECEDKIMEFQL